MGAPATSVPGLWVLPGPWVLPGSWVLPGGYFPQPCSPPAAWQIQPNRAGPKHQKNLEEPCFNREKLRGDDRTVFSPRGLALMSWRQMNKSRRLFALGWRLRGGRWCWREDGALSSEDGFNHQSLTREDYLQGL